MRIRRAAASPHACTTGLIAMAIAATLSSAAMAAHNDMISVSASTADPNTKVASVKIADLDLTNATAQRELHARLALAVNEVCTFGSEQGPRLPVDLGCAGDAKADAERQAAAIIAMAGSPQASAMPVSVALHGSR